MDRIYTFILLAILVTYHSPTRFVCPGNDHRSNGLQAESALSGAFESPAAGRGSITPSPRLDGMPGWRQPSANQQGQGAVKLVMKELAKSDRRHHGELWIRYPQIIGLKDVNVQMRANGVLKSAFGIEGKKKVEIDEDTEYTDKAEVALNSDHLLSVVGLRSQYSDGAAHPYADVHAVTLDTRTGKQYLWRDLIQTEAPHFDSLVRAQLDLRYENHWFETLGKEPEFYLTRDSIVFLLNGVISYSGGTPEVAVAYRDIGQFILPDTPLAIFLEKKE
jgi:hypothetical protein